MKLETYLRLVGRAYQTVTLKSLRASPTGKAPFIDDGGQVIADPGLIIAHLEAKYGHPVDGRLTLAQRAGSLALQRMMEEHLYWVAVYMRWVDPERRMHWQPYFHALLGLPGWITPLVSRMALKRVAATLRHNGIGRHPPETIWRSGISDVRPWRVGWDSALGALARRRPWSTR